MTKTPEKPLLLYSSSMTLTLIQSGGSICKKNLKKSLAHEIFNELLLLAVLRNDQIGPGLH